MSVEFREFPKIPRGQNETITITEKIDGTNACVIVQDGVVVGAQSRNRIITPEADNFGFANWVYSNTDKLVALGDGYHYGEWAGPGIQSNPHQLDKKRFFLFNTARWNESNPGRPDCCDVVPILYEGTSEIIPGEFEGFHDPIQETFDKLLVDAKTLGYTPEGIVVWYHKTRRYEKYTFKNQNGKWQAA